MFLNSMVTSGSYSWEKIILYGFFLTDSLNWIGAAQGYDFRVNYLILTIGILFLFATRSVLIPKEYVVLFLSMPLLSIISNQGKWSLLLATSTQMIGIIPFAILAYNIARNINLNELARIYINISILIAGSVLFEQMVFIIAGYNITNALFLPLGGIDFGYVEGELLRSQGLLYEPSQVGLLLSPAIYLALKLRKKWAAFLILAGIIGSLSSLAFIGLIIAVVLANFSVKRLVFLFPFIFVFVIAAIQVPAVESRVEKATFAFFDKGLDSLTREDLSNLGGSVGTSTANLVVASYGLADSPLIGHGLGSFAILFPEYLEEGIPGAGSLKNIQPGQGKSLFVRILFEFGLIGLAAVLVFFSTKWVALFKMYRESEDGRLRAYWATTVIVFFLVYMIRKEAYVSFYIWFFLSIFIIAVKDGNRHSKKYRRDVSDADELRQSLVKRA